ncbi:ETS translocation variant 5-like [Notothenia coriiceps]|uniref:ETS translocation variant 5-like n=1 Tax=Notothenia coriiceps TaxID=8208 RepID=A0A6I9NIT4_9TELE|nr:PREDICTED: ETS translocation variant 5-like [Notothenia coriiceps]
MRDLEIQRGKQRSWFLCSQVAGPVFKASTLAGYPPAPTPPVVSLGTYGWTSLEIRPYVPGATYSPPALVYRPTRAPAGPVRGVFRFVCGGSDIGSEGGPEGGTEFFETESYVQASKRDKKFATCPPNFSYASLCECLRRAFIYRQPSPVETVLFNRKQGRQVGQVAKQQVASLDSDKPILGFRATNERLYILTSTVAFHSPPVTIKKEPQSPGSDPSQSCSHKQSFSYPSGEQCLYASAYDQKRAAGGAKSSCPGTPMSPMQQHYSPKPATAGRPDAGYMNPAAASQPLPSNSYPINASSRYQGPSGDPMCPQFPPQSSQAFQRMPSAPAGHSGAGGGGAGGPGGGGGGGYHRQHSDPCMPYLQQSFKQEYMDPLYERAAHMAGPGHGGGPGHAPHPHHQQHPHSHPHPHRFPPAHMMVKQEPTDYTYEPGE